MIEDALQRRERLETKPNPEIQKDYIVTFRDLKIGQRSVDLWYVPDKLILDIYSVKYWLKSFDTMLSSLRPPQSNLEEIAVLIRDDLNNELVPRWLQIILTEAQADESGPAYQVILEDRQPRWDNRHLLGRIRRV
ncbi:MAG: hypothetical protein ACPGOV_10210 [Magnetovibrionaceae bacterium]